MSRTVAFAIRKLLVRTEGTPLGRVGPTTYESVARTLAWYLRRFDPSASCYARGGLATGELAPGYSDVDLAVVVDNDRSQPGARRARVSRRWFRLRRVFPVVGEAVDLGVYEQAELDQACEATTLVSRRPVHLVVPAPADEASLRVRPGLEGPARDWRLLSGRDRRPTRVRSAADELRIAAWLDLQFLWRAAFTACANPSAPSVANLCIKFVADPTRIWIALVHGHILRSRRQALERALVEFPDEEVAVRKALALRDALRRLPEPPLDDTLPALVRLSARIAATVAAEAERAGSTAVRLERRADDDLALPDRAGDRLREFAGAEPELLPLADWRSRVWPLYPEHAVAPLAFDPADPKALGAAARVAGDYGPYPAVRVGGLLVLPGPGLLRAVQCRVTDPVTFALLDGAEVARFPNVAGWSAADSARRAVDEHRAWLGADGDGRPAVAQWMSAQARTTEPDVQTLGCLLTAAQAALFAESIQAGEPALAVTLAAAARSLDARLGNPVAVGEEAFAHYRACRVDGRRPSARVVAALRAKVLELPTYAFSTPWRRPGRATGTLARAPASS